MFVTHRMLFAFVAVAAVGCGNTAAKPDGATSGSDGGSGDAALVQVADGSATRETCTSRFGTALTADYGRLDGYLVAIVPPGTMSSCNDDDSHVHLQIQMSGSIYDIAIDATDEASGVDDVHTSTLDIGLPSGPAWAEGWHTGVIVDYVALGVHSTDIPLESKADIVSTLMTELATVNHVSIYSTGYGDDGAHLVHRNGSGHDGLLVTQPLSNPAHARLFSFSSQSF